uniref:Auxin-responsive protein n=1 Tax=Wollemia nobilis TaxID=56998 RepID=A0A0C9QNR9_9CONI
MDMAATSGFAFSNSGRAIMASAAASVVSAGTKRGPHEYVESDPIHHTSALPKEQAVGWPPIAQFRRRSKIPSNPRHSVDDEEECVQQTNKSVQNQNQNQKQGSSLYVKVNMDGVPIGRKVDLNVHESYETLAFALEEMFQRPANVNGQNAGQISLQKAHSVANEAKRSRLLDGSSDFVLTYEDKEGDWMLVGDVPWRMFVNTVKRLKIMKTTDANGLGPRCPEKLNRHKSKPV